MGDAKMIRIPNALHDMILELEGKEILCSLSTIGSKKKKND